MKTLFIRYSSLSLFIFTFVSCLKLDTDLKKDLDIKTLVFPPKLAVSATLDGEKGDFRIFIAEGRALAGYISYTNEVIIRDGEIRLFEDDKLILSEPGPIDMSYILPDHYKDENGNWVYRSPNYWYGFYKSGIPTRAGSVYRLEVEVEGYETAIATMAMPSIPVVSASTDTTVMVIKNLSRSSSVVGYWTEPRLGGKHFIDLSDDSYEVGFWTVSVYITDLYPNENNYFALKIDGNINLVGYHSDMNGIGVSDISILQDDPNLEARRGGLVDMDHTDFYVFETFFMSDRTFSGKTAPLTFYSVAEKTSDPYMGPYFANDPAFEKIMRPRTTFLRIQHFSESTFRYYRGQALQRQRVGFFTEPVTITGNMENGYGHFAVINTITIPILEYEFQDYRRIETQEE